MFVDENVMLPHTSSIRHQPQLPPFHQLEPQTELLYCPHHQPHQQLAIIDLLPNHTTDQKQKVLVFHHQAHHNVLTIVHNQVDQFDQFVMAAQVKNAPIHQAAHFQEKLNVVQVRLQSPCTFICKIQFVGVIVTVFAHGANVVYCLVI